MTSKFIKLEQKYGAQNYAPLPVVLTKGDGVFVWDENGKRYLDMMSAYSAVSHGHCHPRLVAALKDQASKLNIVSRAFYTDKLGLFLQKICHMSGFDKALAMNTGAEAVETALKAARKWAYEVKGVPQDAAEIIACEGNFHGRTISIIGLSTEELYRNNFGPFPSGLKRIPYNDLDALEAAINKNTAAFIVEPIKGEGGIIVPDEGYLKKAYEICKKHNVLLICDEVQTGLGRTGKLFAYEYDGIKPDGLILGKALGGGILPVSLFLTSNTVMDVFTPGTHGSTFGGNPLSAAVGFEALTVLEEENLIQKAALMGEYFKEQLKSIQSKAIKTVRGKGLLIGVEINAPYSAHDICLKMLEHGVLTKETHETVIRFAPPLIITKDEIDQAISALKAALKE